MNMSLHCAGMLLQELQLYELSTTKVNYECIYLMHLSFMILSACIQLHKQHP